ALEISDNVRPVLEKFQLKENKIELLNEKNEKKVFKLNWNENIIEGRGIKGFFKDNNFNKGFLEVTKNEDLKISFYKEIEKTIQKEIDVPPDNVERLYDILSRIKNGISDDKKFFDIYNNAKVFSNSSELDNLICFPHLREISIFEYQVKTVKELLKRFKGRVILSDEVGLGKTIEACIGMLEYIMRGLVKKILILVPPSLVDQWYYELKRKFNQDFIRYDDPEFKRYGDSSWNHFNKVIASLSTAKRKSNSDIISKIQYDLIIVDEAHHLKNRKTLAWNFVNSLNKKYIFLLTATPVQNSLEELYNLITLLKPGQLKTYSYFKKNFIASNSGIEVKNPEKLRELVSSVMIRNKRSDIDIKFTKRFAATHIVDLSTEEKKLYNSLSNYIKDEYKNESPVLTRFMLKSLQEEMGSTFHTLKNTLFKILHNGKLSGKIEDNFLSFFNQSKKIVESKIITPKLIQLSKIIKDFDDKLLIFTKYKATQEYISSFLSEQGYIVAEFHGGLKRSEKENQINLFKESANVLVSTEAGGEGRNLQFCNGMVNYDLPWNPMAIEQRIGRIHRVGQERDVHVFNLASKDTIEHYILELLDKKINMFELVIGEVDMIIGDIEENESFSDMVMNAWTSSKNDNEVVEHMENIGDRLKESKTRYNKIKEIDDKLFDGLKIIDD
ncbi:MAG: SNF2-related protein, partial [Clostridiales bacterium]